MRALSGFVVRHRLLVALFWLAVFAVGAVTAGKVSGRLSQDFSTPSAPSYPVNQAILRTYGTGGDGYPEAVLITVPAGTTVDDPRTAQALQHALDAVTTQPGLRVVSYLDTGDQRLVTADRRTTLALVFSPHHSEVATTDVGAQASRILTPLLPPGTTVQTTGLTELSTGGSSGQGPGVLTETLLGALGALAVLAFVFGSLLALLPLLVAGVSILATFLVLLGLTALTQVNFIVQFLVALIGLGVAIDYSLLLVTRWREERAHGHTGPEAVHRAMATAGRAIVFSGLTVAVGLIALVFLPVPFLRSIGYGGMLIPLVSVAVALTLLPALLVSIGPRLDWPHLRREATAGRGWTAWARGVIRYRWSATLAAVAVLAALGFAATGIQVGEPQADALAGTSGHGGAPVTALRAMEHAGVPTGVLSPIEILTTAGTDPTQVANRLRQIPGVYAALAPTDPGWRHGGTALVEVLPVAETSTPTGAATLAGIRDAAAHLPGVSVGGAGATVVDETHAFYQRFPLMLAAITLVTLILLARAFRSLLLPLKAVVLNLVSVAATYGVLVLVWQRGYGSHAIWGIPATAAITNWVPLMTFAFLFGLSMDYEVFILARVRETYDRTGSTPAAITEGIGRTGRLVTSAALILFCAFAALASGPETDVKVMATGLGAGILLDATIVRALLVPALISLLGRWNWWLPAPAARLLHVPPSPARREDHHAPIDGASMKSSLSTQGSRPLH